MNSWISAWTVLVVIFSGGLIAGKLTEKPKIPDVAAFLLLGILFGPVGLNWISEPSESEVSQLILNLGATLILFDGGRGVSFAVLREAWVSIGLLATLGVLVSAAVVGVAAHMLLGASWVLSFLLASVIASTDPATLIPVFKRVHIHPRLEQTVESESAFNDATAAVLVITIAAFATGHTEVSWWYPVWSFLHSAVIGLVVGLVCGLLALLLVSQEGWGIFHEYGSIVSLTVALGSYQCASVLHASGFMAAFTAGVVTGNGKSFGWAFAEHTEANIHHFGNAITVIFRMLIFVLLGTQVNFEVVRQYLWSGLLIVVVLVVLARPLTVLSSVLVDRNARWTWREILFMFWVRETGVIPAALAGVLAATPGIRGTDVISAITFLAILLTILVQASSTGLVAKRLGLLRDRPDEDI